ncbi:MAG: 1-acyl-sn-glycerol-3-phosphate acyltransferase [Actinomycetaceae bacterium]|nr:1-acyl-sn-glycerol-3-phosphate acyltransferase [Actinomycetaceae bacterium]
MSGLSSRLFPAAEAGRFLKTIALPARMLNRTIQRVTITGQEHIPRSGPALVVANHTVHLDAASVGVAVYDAGRAPAFAAAVDFFRYPGLGLILKNIGAVPVYRDVPNAADSLDGIRQALDAGRVVVLFPEGTFTRDPQLWPMRGKTGISRLMASHPHVPVIPVAHWGNEGIYNPWTNKLSLRKLGKTTRLDVVIGEPLNYSVSADADYEELTVATGHVIAEITKLLVPLREANSCGLSPVPRERPWDRAIDGDPFEEDNVANRSRRAQLSRVWGAVTRPVAQLARLAKRFTS